MNNKLEKYIAELKSRLDDVPLDRVGELADKITESCDKGGTVFVAGNGGSAATASHFVCDINKTVLGKESKTIKSGRLRMICLNDNVSTLTAWANDSSFDDIFSEPLRNLAEGGDVLISITGSGNSPNILRAIETAKELGVYTAGFLGFDGGGALKILDFPIMVESDSYGIIEDVHMALVHMLTEILKDNFNDTA